MCIHVLVQHSDNEHVRFMQFIKNSVMLDLQSAIPGKNKRIVNAEQRMTYQLFHSCLKLIQVRIRLINTPFFAGIHPNSYEVRFRLRCDAKLKH